MLGITLLWWLWVGCPSGRRHGGSLCLATATAIPTGGCRTSPSPWASPESLPARSERSFSPDDEALLGGRVCFAFCRAQLEPLPLLSFLSFLSLLSPVTAPCLRQPRPPNGLFWENNSGCWLLYFIRLLMALLSGPWGPSVASCGEVRGEEALGPHVKSGKQHPESCKPCAVLHPVEPGVLALPRRDECRSDAPLYPCDVDSMSIFLLSWVPLPGSNSGPCPPVLALLLCCWWRIRATLWLFLWRVHSTSVAPLPSDDVLFDGPVWKQSRKGGVAGINATFSLVPTLCPLWQRGTEGIRFLTAVQVTRTSRVGMLILTVLNLVCAWMGARGPV